jgi:hypothetical protein
VNAVKSSTMLRATGTVRRDDGVLRGATNFSRRVRTTCCRRANRHFLKSMS